MLCLIAHGRHLRHHARRSIGLRGPFWVVGDRTVLTTRQLFDFRYPRCHCALLKCRPFARGRRRYSVAQRRLTSAPVNRSLLLESRPGWINPSFIRLFMVLGLTGLESPSILHTSDMPPFQSSGMSGQVFRRFMVYSFSSSAIHTTLPFFQ